MQTSDQTDQILPALFTARASIGRAVTKNTRGHGYTYADLAQILGTMGEAFSDAGLMEVCSQVSPSEVVCRVYHVDSAQWIQVSSAVDASAEEAKKGGTKGAQAAGSAYTYGRRYCLMAILGLAAEDDDGRAASERHRKASPSGPVDSGGVDDELVKAGIDVKKARAWCQKNVPQDLDEWPAGDIRRFISDVKAGKVTL